MGISPAPLLLNAVCTAAPGPVQGSHVTPSRLTTAGPWGGGGQGKGGRMHSCTSSLMDAGMQEENHSLEAPDAETFGES